MHFYWTNRGIIASTDGFGRPANRRRNALTTL